VALETGDQHAKSIRISTPSAASSKRLEVFFVLFHLNRTVEKGVICLCNYYEYLCMPFEGRAGVLESPFSVGENT